MSLARKVSAIELRTDIAHQECIRLGCGTRLSVEEAVFECPKCGDLLDVVYDWPRLGVPRRLTAFEDKWARRSDPHCFSGVSRVCSRRWNFWRMKRIRDHRLCDFGKSC